MLRISVLCDDAEAMYNMWQKILHDPTGKFKVVRLKNKIGKGQTPYLAVWKSSADSSTRVEGRPPKN